MASKSTLAQGAFFRLLFLWVRARLTRGIIILKNNLVIDKVFIYIII